MLIMHDVEDRSCSTPRRAAHQDLLVAGLNVSVQLAYPDVAALDVCPQTCGCVLC